MKVKSRILRVNPALSLDWRERDRNSDAEDKLAKRFVESSQPVSGSKKEVQLIYNRFGSLVHMRRR
jgi:hypothetical protein|tara:strand:- start:1660 stop:1857 length:198 start_codon:yes stop_codon:yes gene_type:complete